MAASRKYRSEIAASVHEMVQGFERAGLVSKQTMREFDARCLVAVQDISADEIRAIRQKEAVSQPVFAQHLNVSRNLVSDWERGVKKPGGPALKLLSIVRKGGLEAIS